MDNLHQPTLSIPEEILAKTENGIFHLNVSAGADNEEMLLMMSTLDQLGYVYSGIDRHPQGGRSIVYKRAS